MRSDLERAEAYLASLCGTRLLRNEPLSRHTSFAIGGPADLFVAATSTEEVSALASYCARHGLPVLWLGGGTNVLVSDAGVRGLAVANACRDFHLDEAGQLVGEAGAQLRDVAAWTVARGWAGLEWAVGIPGTLGGAVVGNAGAYGGCMSDAVMWVDVVEGGERRRLGADELDYGYRTSALKREPWQQRQRVVLQTGLRLTHGDAGELARTVERITAQREARTPQGHSAGSVFKRTLQYPAGFLVEQAGLKGERIGGAEVSTRHANYIMNVGGASAADVRALIERVQERVWAAFAQRLEPEIEFVGEWS